MFLVVSQHTRSRRSDRRAILGRNGPDADLDDHKGVPMQKSTMMRMGAVGAVCALVGGAAGIAASSASSPPATKVVGASGVIAEGPGLPFGLGPLADATGPPVHSENVVPNKNGGFDTVTIDRG